MEPPKKEKGSPSGQCR